MTDEVSTSLPSPNYHFTERDKERVRMAAPNGDRCLVTNTCDKAVEYCHCIPMESMQDEKLVHLDSLEWFWNMKHMTLNLDTRYNVFFVDHLAWLLLPEDYIVDKYWDSLKFSGRSAKRERFPNFPERKTFLYKFVPLDGMEFVIINYRDTIPEDRARDHSNFTSYFHPFDKLQPLESHLHPKFVIYNARLKLDRVLDSESTLVESFEKFPSLLKILDLYRAWTRERPSNALEDLSYNDPSDPSATTVMTLKTVTTVLEPIEPSAGVWGIGPLRFLRKGCLDLISNSGKLPGQITASASGQERRENLALPLIYPCPHSFFILNLHKYQFKI